MFKRNLIKVYVLIWFITGCKISYKTYNFEDSPNIETPDYSKSNSWAVLPNNLPDEIAYLNKTEEKKNADVFFIYPTLIDGKNQKEWNSDVRIQPQIHILHLLQC